MDDVLTLAAQRRRRLAARRTVHQILTRRTAERSAAAYRSLGLSAVGAAEAGRDLAIAFEVHVMWEEACAEADA